MPAWSSFTGDHFIIHYRGPDRAVIHEIEQKLADNYFRLTNFFEVNFDDQIDVFIHPDLNSLKNTLNYQAESDWLVGVAVGDEAIHLVSPRNPPGIHTYQSVMDGLIHEFVHICVARASKNQLPVWLHEGLAVYYAGQMRFAQEVPGLVKDLNILPSLQSISNPDTFADRNGYPLSYTIIEMVEEFAGQSGISRWVKEYPDCSALGIRGLSELEDLWHHHLESKYQHPQPLKKWLDNSGNPFQISLDPNPIVDFGEMKFVVPSDGTLYMEVLDPWGRKIQTLFSNNIESGFHGFRIDARKFPPGIYYLELRTADQEQLVRFTH